MLAALIAGPPSVSLAAPPGPNLTIVYDGFNPTSADRVIRFKITNVGTQPTDATESHIETLSGSPTNNLTTPTIPPLAVGASYEVYYSLYKMDGTVGCDGAIVRATVYLPNDVDRSNDTTGPVTVCAQKPPPPAPIVVGPAPRSVPVPDYATPGEHVVDLPPSVVKSYFLDRMLNDGSCGPYPFNSMAESGATAFVGWFQVDDDEGFFSPDCRYVGEGQTAVNFDYGMFDNISSPRITRATLMIAREIEQEWGGNLIRPQGCITTLGLPTVAWEHTTYEPIPQEAQPYRTVATDTTSTFDVTSAVAQQVNGQRARRGFVLRGALGIDDLAARGSSSCLSAVEGLLLRVTYVV